MHPRKALVRDCYNVIADAIARERLKRERNYPSDWQREQRWLARLLDSLPAGGRVLDLGCGDGEPILSGLVARGFRATGVDLAHEQVRRARAGIPGAALVEADLAEVAFADASFEGLVAYDSIWHVPRQEHASLFTRMRRWMVAGGSVLLTLGADEPVGPDAPGLTTDLLGMPTFYDCWPVATSLQLLRAAGFRIVDHDCHPAPRGHLIVLACAQP